jgi:hypothetical protein
MGFEPLRGSEGVGFADQHRSFVEHPEMIALGVNEQEDCSFATPLPVRKERQ